MQTVQNWITLKYILHVRVLCESYICVYFDLYKVCVCMPFDKIVYIL